MTTITTTTAWRRPGRAILLAVVVLAALAAGGLMGARPADATNAYYEGFGGTPSAAPSGAYVVSPVIGTTTSSLLGVCITYGAAGPDQIPNAVYTLGALPANGPEATLGWLLQHFGATGWDGYTARTFDAGVSAVAQQRYNIAPPPRTGPHSTTVQAASMGAIESYIDTYPGPWHVVLSPGTGPFTATATHSGTVTIESGATPVNLGVASVAVLLNVPGAPSSVTVSGAGSAAFAWKKTPAASFTAAAAAGELPEAGPWELYPPVGSGGQRLLAGYAPGASLTSQTWRTSSSPPAKTTPTLFLRKVASGTTGPAIAGAVFSLETLTGHVRLAGITTNGLTTGVPIPITYWLFAMSCGVASDR